MPARMCAEVGCGVVVHRGRWCRSHRSANEARRGSAASRGYGREWQRARADYLERYPLCLMCSQAGQVCEAAEVDHIKPVGSAEDSLFWVESNWQPLCGECHKRKTATEDGGFGRARAAAGRRG
jgi:5-methylcytosine-specific restriction protein A